MPLHRRMPKRGFNNIFRIEYAVVNLDQLEERFEAAPTCRPTRCARRGWCAASDAHQGPRPR